MYPSALAANRTSPGLHGEYGVSDALTHLLDGTGLDAQAQDDGSFTLVQAATPAMSDATLPAVKVTSDALKASTYRAPKEANVTRSDTTVLDTAQAVNVVPAQVIRDQRPRNLDDALANVSGIVQGNTLAGTQDTMLKRGFGGNRDGSIMSNGMPLVQGRAYNAAADSVEVLKGPTSLL